MTVLSKTLLLFSSSLLFFLNFLVEVEELFQEVLVVGVCLVVEDVNHQEVEEAVNHQEVEVLNLTVVEVVFLLVVEEAFHQEVEEVLYLMVVEVVVKLMVVVQVVLKLMVVVVLLQVEEDQLALMMVCFHLDKSFVHL